MEPISAPQLAQWLADAARPDPVLLDVREPWEAQICRIDGSALVPLRTVPAQLAALEPARPVVCICHHGARSAQAAMFLGAHGFAQVFNLTGGINAWAREVDRAMAVY